MKKRLFTRPATIWFELPFRVFLDLTEKKVFKTFNGEKLTVTLQIRNDIVKTQFADFYDRDKSWDEYREKLSRGKRRPPKLVSDAYDFVTLAEFDKLKQKDNRVRGQFSRTYVSVKVRLPYNFLPPRDLIFPFLFDWINDILDTYRISALPGVRYTIDTISEANLNFCIIRIGKGTINYGFSVRDHGMRSQPYFFEDYGVEDRFKALRGKLSDNEITFSLAFPLFHQHRHKEALLVAYSACESLLKDLVFALSKDKQLASVLWKTNRNRSDDLFKELLPALGADNIAVKSKTLWDRFKSARDARGLSAHDGGLNKIGEAQIQKHLEVFYDVACWLISQSKGKLKPWNLELTNKKTGEVLKKQFP